VIVKNSYRTNDSKKYKSDNIEKMNTIDHVLKNKQNDVNINIKEKNWEDESSDTDRDAPMNDEPIRNLIKCN
jgi:hypothetical protein